MEEFIKKKQQDLATHQVIYWYNRHSRPDWPKITEPTYVLMFEGGQTPKGGDGSNVAEMFNESTNRDAGTWRALPRGMKVTGKMDGGAAALVMTNLRIAGERRSTLVSSLRRDSTIA
jgi:hypothetical protein